MRVGLILASPRVEPRPLDPESNALTMKPPRLDYRWVNWVPVNCYWTRGKWSVSESRLILIFLLLISYWMRKGHEAFKPCNNNASHKCELLSILKWSALRLTCLQFVTRMGQRESSESLSRKRFQTFRVRFQAAVGYLLGSYES